MDPENKDILRVYFSFREEIGEKVVYHSFFLDNLYALNFYNKPNAKFIIT